MSNAPRPRRALDRRVVLSAGAFAVCLVAGLGLGRSHHHDDAGASATAEALPVLQPSGYGEADLPMSPGASLAAMGPEGPVTATKSGIGPSPEGPLPSVVPRPPIGGVEPTSDVTGTPDPTGGARPSGLSGSSTSTTSTGASTTIDSTGTTLGEPPALGDLPALDPLSDLTRIGDPPGIVQLLDPCIAGGDGCPDGIAGTILPDRHEQLEIRDVTAAITPARFALYDQCVRDLDHPDARSAILAIVSNHPATFTLTGSWSGAAATSDRARARWQDDIDRDDPHGVVTCALLTPAGRRGEITVSGEDDLGSTDTFTTVVDAQPLDHKRPPISVVSTGDMSLRATVPLRANEVVEVVAHTRDDPDGEAANDCGGTVVRRIESTATQTTVALPASVLDLVGYPYDPAWDRVALVDVHLTGPSVPYDLCVRWLSRPRSFDTPQLVDAEARLVQPPTRPDVQVSVEGVVPGRDAIDTRQLVLDLKTPEGAPGCTLAAGSPGFPLATGPDKYAHPVPMCRLHTGATGEWTTASITHRGAELRSSLRLTTRVCHTGSVPVVGCTGPVTEWYTLAVPKPTGGTSDGVVLLRLDYNAPHATTGSSSYYADRDTWGIFPGSDVHLPDADGAPVVNLQPQLDTYATTVRVEGGVEGESTVIVDWVADRPVAVTATVESNDADTCSRDPHPTATSEALATHGTLRLAGLCAGTRSSVGLTLRTDGPLRPRVGSAGTPTPGGPTGGTPPATGYAETASYSDVDGAHADRVGPGFGVTTNGRRLTISPALLFDSDLSTVPTGAVARSLFIWAGSGYRPIILAAVEYEVFDGALNPHLGLFPCASLPTFRFTPATYPSPARFPHISATQDVVWPEDMHLHVDAWLHIGTDPCDLPNGHPAIATQEYSFDVTVTTAGPTSVLLHPSTTYGSGSNRPADGVAGPGVVLQLNARS